MYVAGSAIVYLPSTVCIVRFCWNQFPHSLAFLLSARVLKAGHHHLIGIIFVPFTPFSIISFFCLKVLDKAMIIMKPKNKSDDG